MLKIIRLICLKRQSEIICNRKMKLIFLFSFCVIFSFLKCASFAKIIDDDPATKPPLLTENLRWLLSQYAESNNQDWKVENRRPFVNPIFESSNLNRHERNADLLKCPPGATGAFPYPLDCKLFLNCWKGRGTVQVCAPGTLFNSETKVCDDPSIANCADRQKIEDVPYPPPQPIALSNPDAKPEEHGKPEEDLHVASSSNINTRYETQEKTEDQGQVLLDEGQKADNSFDNPWDGSKIQNPTNQNEKLESADPKPEPKPTVVDYRGTNAGSPAKNPQPNFGQQANIDFGDEEIANEKPVINRPKQPGDTETIDNPQPATTDPSIHHRPNHNNHHGRHHPGYPGMPYYPNYPNYPHYPPYPSNYPNYGINPMHNPNPYSFYNPYAYHQPPYGPPKGPSEIGNTENDKPHINKPPIESPLGYGTPQNQGPQKHPNPHQQPPYPSSGDHTKGPFAQPKPNNEDHDKHLNVDKPTTEVLPAYGHPQSGHHVPEKHYSYSLPYPNVPYPASADQIKPQNPESGSTNPSIPHNSQPNYYPHMYPNPLPYPIAHNKNPVPLPHNYYHRPHYQLPYGRPYVEEGTKPTDGRQPIPVYYGWVNPQTGQNQPHQNVNLQPSREETAAPVDEANHNPTDSKKPIIDDKTTRPYPNSKNPYGSNTPSKSPHNPDSDTKNKQPSKTPYGEIDKPDVLPLNTPTKSPPYHVPNINYPQPHYGMKYPTYPINQPENTPYGHIDKPVANPLNTPNNSNINFPPYPGSNVNYPNPPIYDQKYPSYVNQKGKQPPYGDVNKPDANPTFNNPNTDTKSPLYPTTNINYPYPPTYGQNYPLYQNLPIESYKLPETYDDKSKDIKNPVPGEQPKAPIPSYGWKNPYDSNIPTDYNKPEPGTKTKKPTKTGYGSTDNKGSNPLNPNSKTPWPAYPVQGEKDLPYPPIRDQKAPYPHQNLPTDGTVEILPNTKPSKGFPPFPSGNPSNPNYYGKDSVHGPKNTHDAILPLPNPTVTPIWYPMPPPIGPKTENWQNPSYPGRPINEDIKTVKCQPGEVQHHESCYKLIEKETFNGNGPSFSDAFNHCADLGGSLLEVTSESENEFISKWLAKDHPNVKAVLTGGIETLITDSDVRWMWRGSKTDIKVEHKKPGSFSKYKRPEFELDDYLCLVLKQRNQCHDDSDEDDSNEGQKAKFPDSEEMQKSKSSKNSDESKQCSNNNHHLSWDLEHVDELPKVGYAFVCERPNIDIGCIPSGGQPYLGNATIASGHQCLHWNDPRILKTIKIEQEIGFEQRFGRNAHAIYAHILNYGQSNSHNHCRDLMGNGKPWCFIDHRNLRTEQCKIPECHDVSGIKKQNIKNYNYKEVGQKANHNFDD